MTEAVSDKIGYANRGFTGMLSDTAAQEEQKGERGKKSDGSTGTEGKRGLK